MANLIEGIQQEQKRCRELLGHYKEIGPVGRFGHIMISQVIDDSEKAVASGDVVEMMATYQRLQGCE